MRVSAHSLQFFAIFELVVLGIFFYISLALSINVDECAAESTLTRRTHPETIQYTAEKMTQNTPNV